MGAGEALVDVVVAPVVHPACAALAAIRVGAVVPARAAVLAGRRVAVVDVNAVVTIALAALLAGALVAALRVGALRVLGARVGGCPALVDVAVALPVRPTLRAIAGEAPRAAVGAYACHALAQARRLG